MSSPVDLTGLNLLYDETSTYLAKQQAKFTVKTNPILASLSSITFEWIKDGSPLADQINADLTIDALAISDTGSYILEITYNGFTYQSNTITIDVISALPINYQKAPQESGYLSIEPIQGAVFQWQRTTEIEGVFMDICGQNTEAIQLFLTPQTASSIYGIYRICVGKNGVLNYSNECYFANYSPLTFDNGVIHRISSDISYNLLRTTPDGRLLFKDNANPSSLYITDSSYNLIKFPDPIESTNYPQLISYNGFHDSVIHSFTTDGQYMAVVCIGSIQTLDSTYNDTLFIQIYKINGTSINPVQQIINIGSSNSLSTNSISKTAVGSYSIMFSGDGSALAVCFGTGSKYYNRNVFIYKKNSDDSWGTNTIENDYVNTTESYQITTSFSLSTVSINIDGTLISASRNNIYPNSANFAIYKYNTLTDVYEKWDGLRSQILSAITYNLCGLTSLSANTLAIDPYTVYFSTDGRKLYIISNYYFKDNISTLKDAKQKIIVFDYDPITYNVSYRYYFNVEKNDETDVLVTSSANYILGRSSGMIYHVPMYYGSRCAANGTLAIGSPPAHFKETTAFPCSTICSTSIDENHYYIYNDSTKTLLIKSYRYLISRNLKPSIENTGAIIVNDQDERQPGHPIYIRDILNAKLNTSLYYDIRKEGILLRIKNDMDIDDVKVGTWSFSLGQKLIPFVKNNWYILKNTDMLASYICLDLEKNVNFNNDKYPDQKITLEYKLWNGYGSGDTIDGEIITICDLSNSPFSNETGTLQVYIKNIIDCPDYYGHYLTPKVNYLSDSVLHHYQHKITTIANSLNSAPFTLDYIIDIFRPTMKMDYDIPLSEPVTYTKIDYKGGVCLYFTEKHLLQISMDNGQTWAYLKESVGDASDLCYFFDPAKNYMFRFASQPSPGLVLYIVPWNLISLVTSNDNTYIREFMDLNISALGQPAVYTPTTRISPTYISKATAETCINTFIMGDISGNLKYSGIVIDYIPNTKPAFKTAGPYELLKSGTSSTIYDTDNTYNVLSFTVGELFYAPSPTIVPGTHVDDECDVYDPDISGDQQVFGLCIQQNNTMLLSELGKWEYTLNGQDARPIWKSIYEDISGYLYLWSPMKNDQMIKIRFLPTYGSGGLVSFPFHVYDGSDITNNTRTCTLSIIHSINAPDFNGNTTIANIYRYNSGNDIDFSTSLASMYKDVSNGEPMLNSYIMDVSSLVGSEHGIVLYSGDVSNVYVQILDVSGERNTIDVLSDMSGYHVHGGESIVFTFMQNENADYTYNYYVWDQRNQPDDNVGPVQIRGGFTSYSLNDGELTLRLEKMKEQPRLNMDPSGSLYTVAAQSTEIQLTFNIADFEMTMPYYEFSTAFLFDNIIRDKYIQHEADDIKGLAIFAVDSTIGDWSYTSVDISGPGSIELGIDISFNNALLLERSDMNLLRLTLRESSDVSMNNYFYTQANPALCGSTFFQAIAWSPSISDTYSQYTYVDLSSVLIPENEIMPFSDPSLFFQFNLRTRPYISNTISRDLLIFNPDETKSTIIPNTYYSFFYTSLPSSAESTISLLVKTVDNVLSYVALEYRISNTDPWQNLVEPLEERIDGSYQIRINPQYAYEMIGKTFTLGIVLYDGDLDLYSSTFAYINITVIESNIAPSISVNLGATKIPVGIKSMTTDTITYNTTYNDISNNYPYLNFNKLISTDGPLIWTDYNRSAMLKIKGFAIEIKEKLEGTFYYQDYIDTTLFIPISINNTVDRILLNAVNNIIYIPKKGYTGNAHLHLYAWDGVNGNNTDIIFKRPDNSYTAGAFSEDYINIVFPIISRNMPPYFIHDNKPYIIYTQTDRNDYSAGTSFIHILTDIIGYDYNYSTNTTAGFAIRTVDTTGIGAWNYSLDAGITWRNIVENQHFICDSSGQTQIRFRFDSSIQYFPQTYEILPSLTVVAWDGINGVSNGSVKQINQTGYSTPYSEYSVFLTSAIEHRNHAPSLLSSGPYLIGSIPSNQTFTIPVSDIIDIIGVSYYEPDIGDSAGIMPVDISSAKGTWSYTNDILGDTYQILRFDTEFPDKILASNNAILRFIPDLYIKGPTFLAIKACDDGNSTNDTIGYIQLDIEDVNYAPYFSYNIPITYDVSLNNPITITVASILRTINPKDINDPSIFGIIITSDIWNTSLFTLEYTLNNMSMFPSYVQITNSNIGPTTYAIHLPSTAMIRYTSHYNENVKTSFKCIVWDQSNMNIVLQSVGHSAPVPFERGGFTSYSAETFYMDFNHVKINKAPVIITNNTPYNLTNRPYSIDDLYRLIPYSDEDANNKGIVLIGVDTYAGHFEYGSDDLGWNIIGTNLTSTYGLFFEINYDMYIRYVPTLNVDDYSRLIFCAWDQTDKNTTYTYPCTLPVPSIRGANTSYSIGIWTFEFTQAHLNQIPILIEKTTILDIMYDSGNYRWFSFQNYVAIEDPDFLLIKRNNHPQILNQTYGIVVTSVDVTNVTWFTSLDYQTVRILENISPSNALLLDISQNFAILPLINEDAQFNITYKLWDMTYGSVGDYIDTTDETNTSYSVESSIIQINVHQKPSISTLSILNNLPSTIGNFVIDSNGSAVSTILGGAGENCNSIIIQNPQMNHMLGFWAYKEDEDINWSLMMFPEETTTWVIPNNYTINFIFYENITGSVQISLYGWTSNANKPIISNTINSRTIPGILQKNNVKIMHAPKFEILNPIVYDKTFQDTDYIINFGDSFFSKIEYGHGIVISDLSGGGVGTWSYKYENNTTWSILNPINFSNGMCLHVKKYATGQKNIILRFSPGKYKYGGALFRMYLWNPIDGVHDCGTWANLPAIHDPHGSYSQSSKMFMLNVENVADPPKIYRTRNIELITNISANIITYSKDYIPANDGSDSITVSDVLAEFDLTRNFAAQIIDVDSNFNKYDYSTLGIAIETCMPDISFQYFQGIDKWKNYTTVDFNGGRLLHLQYNDKFRIRAPNGSQSITFSFRIWNRKNSRDPTISTSIVNYNTISGKGPYYSVPINAQISYSSTRNIAPVINIREPSFLYILGTQNEDTGLSAEFDIQTIIGNLKNVKSGDGLYVITDGDGDYITNIPLFGLAFFNGTVGLGDWKIRRQPNGPAETLDFTKGYFHVSGDSGAKIYYDPKKQTNGSITLQAYIWDRSNDVHDVSYNVISQAWNKSLAYSEKSVTFQLNIKNVNHRPYVSAGHLQLPTISYKEINNRGESLYTMMNSNGFRLNDPDQNDRGVHGIVVTGVCNSLLGYWQYSILSLGRNRYNWINIPDTNGTGLHLDPIYVDPNTGAKSANDAVRLRFIPNVIGEEKLKTGIRMFDYLVWDKRNGVQNGTVAPINIMSDTSYSLIVYNGRIYSSK